METNHVAERIKTRQVDVSLAVSGNQEKTGGGPLAHRRERQGQLEHLEVGVFAEQSVCQEALQETARD